MTGHLREWWERTIGFIRRRKVDEDLDAELADYQEHAVQDHLRQGLGLEEARRRAAATMGSPLALRETVSDQRGWPEVESLFQDVVYAIRGLRRHRGFTAVAVTTLAVGIGINAAVFTVAKAALFAGFPGIAQNDRIVYVSSGRGCCLSYPDFLDWRARARSFTGMAIVAGVSGTLNDDSGYPESYDATEVSANTFGLIGTRPLVGRDFVQADTRVGAAPVVILSHGFWERRFDKERGLLGHAVRLNGIPTTVIGIMPEGFAFPQKQDLWVPMVETSERLQRRDARSNWFSFGRLADGVTVESARAELAIIGRRLGAEYPQTNQGRNLLPHVQAFQEFFILEKESPIYWAMWGAVALVLLIACANLANLNLARTMDRGREISVRVALGAGRWRIVRQLLIESLLLTSVGSAAGWWLAEWGVRAYQLADRGPGRSSWRILDYSMDYRVLGYMTAISVTTALFFGLMPVRRLFKLNVGTALKNGARGTTTGVRASRLSSLLITVEMALAVMLLAGAGVMIRSFMKVYAADLGVVTANVLTLEVNLPKKKYPTPEARLAFYDRVETRLEAIPGVESVTLAKTLPGGSSSRSPGEFAGAPVDAAARPLLATMVIGTGYFRTMGAKVWAGRDFSDNDGPATVPVAVVNERFAQTYWPNGYPLGQHVRLVDDKTAGPWLTIVGVVSEIAQDGVMQESREPLMYVPHRQQPVGNMSVLARTRVSPATLGLPFRRVMQAMDSEVPVYGPFSLEERLRSYYWTSGMYGALFTTFAAIALMMASVGLFAVIAYSVSSRTQEIGIRIAVGATPGDIRALVLRQGLTPMVVGLVIGLWGSLGVNRVLAAALVHVSPADPLTLATAAGILVLAGMLGCAVPARRAMKVDPLIAIRYE